MRAKVIGTVTIDLLHTWDATRTTHQIQMGFGGVSKNVACVLGALGAAGDFVSTQYSGDMGHAIANYFNEHNVTWTPIAQIASPGLFQAHIDASGQVFEESFTDNGSLEILTPDVLRQSAHLFAGAGMIITCTNLSVASLDALHEIASGQNVPYCVLVSSDLEARRVGQLARKPDVVAMNRSEMQYLSGKTYRYLAEIAADARMLVSDAGACLVTVGEKGALLALPSEERFIFQPAHPIAVKSPVGAGDVLFTALVVYRYHHQAAWSDALYKATQHTAAYLNRDAGTYPIYGSLHQPYLLTLPACRWIGYEDAGSLVETGLENPTGNT